MPLYRFYWIGADDKIARIDNVDCASDVDARRIAAEYKVASPAVEVWLGEHRVVRMDAPEVPGRELDDGMLHQARRTRWKQHRRDVIIQAWGKLIWRWRGRALS